MSTLEQKIRKLSPELQKAVEVLVNSLTDESEVSQRDVMKLGWRGGLRQLKSEYTSVELQHKIYRSREENVSS